MRMQLISCTVCPAFGLLGIKGLGMWWHCLQTLFREPGWEGRHFVLHVEKDTLNLSFVVSLRELPLKTSK